MVTNIISCLIGIFYGVGFYIIFVNSVRYLKTILIRITKHNLNENCMNIQVAFIYIFSLIFGIIFLLTILLLSHFFSDWHNFVRFWIFGFSIGIYIASQVGKK